jgi:hypothetical protein
MRSFATILLGIDSVPARWLHLQSLAGHPQPGQILPASVE